MDDRWPTVNGGGRCYLAAADKGERHQGGGMVGEVEGYLWMRRWAADATREEKAKAVRGAMGKQKWCVVCPLTYFVRRS